MLSQVPHAAPPQSPQPDRRRDLQRRESDRRRASKVIYLFETEALDKRCLTLEGTANARPSWQQYSRTIYTSFGSSTY